MQADDNMILLQICMYILSKSEIAAYLWTTTTWYDFDITLFQRFSKNPIVVFDI